MKLVVNNPAGVAYLALLAQLAALNDAREKELVRIDSKLDGMREAMLADQEKLHAAATEEVAALEAQIAALHEEIAERKQRLTDDLVEIKDTFQKAEGLASTAREKAFAVHAKKRAAIVAKLEGAGERGAEFQRKIIEAGLEAFATAA